jgi:hypothetical protein
MQTALTGIATKKIKLFRGPGTRQWPRFNVADLPSIKRVTSSAGSEIPVVDISQGGALLRTRSRLVPGTRIQLHFEIAEDDISLSGFVLRSSISSTKRLPRYETAVAFNHMLPILDDGPKPSTVASTVRQSVPFRMSSNLKEISCECDPDEDSAVIAEFLAALNVYTEQDTELSDMFKLNNW